MNDLMTRRTIIAGVSAAAWPLSLRRASAQPSDQASDTIASIERRYGGRLGVFAIDTGSEQTMAYRADERFLLCSTFKGLLAALILKRVDDGKERLDRTIQYDERDLIFTSPVTKANVGQHGMTVGALCDAILEESDNTAAVLLMRQAGGPGALTSFLRGLGDAVTRSDRYEPNLNQYSGVLDTTTPRAIAGSARKLLLSDTLTPASRVRLEKGMIACKPGLNRIRAALPADWVAGDRPGTSVEGETNDYAIVRPPGRAPLLIAAYLDAPKLSMPTRAVVLHDVGIAFVAWAAGTAR